MRDNNPLLMIIGIIAGIILVLGAQSTLTNPEILAYKDSATWWILSFIPEFKLKFEFGWLELITLMVGAVSLYGTCIFGAARAWKPLGYTSLLLAGSLGLFVVKAAIIGTFLTPLP